MSLRARITNHPPKVELTVEDAGGSGPAHTRVRVLFTWDPEVWGYVDHRPADVADLDAERGVILWKELEVRSPGRKLHVTLERLRDQVSYAVVTSAECLRGGEGNQHGVRTPRGPVSDVQEVLPSSARRTDARATRKRAANREVSPKEP